MPPVDPDRPSADRADRSNPGFEEAAANTTVSGGVYTLPELDAAKEGGVVADGSVGSGVGVGDGSVGSGVGVGEGCVGSGVGVGDGREGKVGRDGSDGKVKEGLFKPFSMISSDSFKSWKVVSNALMVDCSSAICPAVSKAEEEEEACNSCATRVDSANALSDSEIGRAHV